MPPAKARAPLEPVDLALQPWGIHRIDAAQESPVSLCLGWNAQDGLSGLPYAAEDSLVAYGARLERGLG